MPKRILAVLIFVILLGSQVSCVFAEPIDDCANKSETEKPSCYENKIAVARSQQKTLSTEITVINSQIEITKLEIDQTEQRLGRLSDNIASVSSSIVRIQESLAQMKDIVDNRIVKTYTTGRIDPLIYLLGAGDFQGLLERFNYLQMAQRNDRKKIIEMGIIQKNYLDQKILFENRKSETEKLTKQLKEDRTKLDAQNRSKQKLLADTQGDEARYALLLSEARAQLAAFGGFVDSQGGASIIDADPSWPSNYFSQRDRRWGSLYIAGYYSTGSKALSISDAGCLISSVAMVRSYRGFNTTPANIGTDSSNFFDGYFIWDSLSRLGFSTPRRTLDRSVINDSLSQGKWVIVGFNHSPSLGGSPFHFVVITRKNDDGDYNICDPWRGPNISLNRNYGSDYITEVITY